MTGKLIVFEGGEGSGKSTQVARLAQTPGRDVLITRQPGGSPVGEIIRGLVLDTDYTICDRAEALLYAADRAQHVHEVIRPALAAGQTVISDRWVDSSIAYQAAGRGMDRDRIADLSAWATGGLIPDLTVLLDIDPRVGLARAARRGAADRLEQEDVGFHNRVRWSYLQQAAANPHRYLVVDATLPADAIAHLVYAYAVQITKGREVAA